MMDDNQDFCRVCRSEGSIDKPLFHPCVCTGSIKFIHQDCLVQWLKYSRKEYCELCKYPFSFTPIYSPDMPKRLPIKDIVTGVLKSVCKAVKCWLHYTLMAIAWLGIVPLTARRMYRCLFTGSVSSLLKLPLDMLSTDNLISDCFQGCFIVTCTLCAFISLVWLREQILHGGGPNWLEEAQELNQNANAEAEANADVAVNNNFVEQENIQDNNNVPDVVNNEEFEVEEVDENVAANDENNQPQDDAWNPIEWDRAAEELTWERLLGLDGSLVFLEHVFWVVSLNTLFILVFAFCPYHIGNFAIVTFKLENEIFATQFQGLLTTLLGYIIISLSLVLCHGVMSFLGFGRFKRLLGLCYVVVKVSLLVVIEMGVFPLVCGWWLDICSMSLFDVSLKDRNSSFKLAPGTSMFIHWLVGMVYVFYFASFILLLREVVRPGVLWFLKNLNDPDFNPIQEMIHLPIYRHVRRVIASMVIFGTAILIMFWLPIKVIRTFFVGFLPFNVLLSGDSAMSELSLELLLLQVVLPALLEQGHSRIWLKNIIYKWCVFAAWLLDLHSYLLGDNSSEASNAGDDGQNAYREAENNVLPAHDQQAENANAEPNVENEVIEERAAPMALGAVHQAMAQGGAPTVFQPFNKPNAFQLRLAGLVLLMCFSLFIASIISISTPVFIGRHIMSLWMGDVKVHELYTAGCGLYFCWILVRFVTISYHWVPNFDFQMFQKVKEWITLGIKSLIVALLLMGVVPLMLGTLFDLVAIAPLRVPLDQSPLFLPMTDWALGVLHTKIICAITMMGPQWWLKAVIDQVYNQGLRQMNLYFVIRHLCIPVITCLGLSLSIPYIIARSFIPVLGLGFEIENLVLRRIYPFILSIIVFINFCLFQAKQCKRLYEHIKNDKYLVGQQLVNYEKTFTNNASKN